MNAPQFIFILMLGFVVGMLTASLFDKSDDREAGIKTGCEPTSAADDYFYNVNKGVVPRCAWCEKELGIRTEGSHGICERHAKEWESQAHEKGVHPPQPWPRK